MPTAGVVHSHRRSDSSRSMDHLQPEEIVRGVRQRRKQSEPIACPVCGVTVRPADMEQHYALEVERLHKLHISDAGQRAAKSAAAARSPSMPANKADTAAGCSTSTAAASSSSAEATGGAGEDAVNGGAGGPIDPKECWSTYQRIKSNRQSRLKIKSRKRKSDDPICPVCSEHIADDINVHVEICLRRGSNRNGHHNQPHHNQQHATTSSGSTTTRTNAVNGDHDDNDAEDGGGDDDDDISIDVESEPFEEYEWAGQTRIRASSLLQGGYVAAGVGTSMQSAAAGDEDEDLNVDGDDSHVFGSSQYGERDVILPSSRIDKENTASLYLRELVAGDSGPTTSADGRRNGTPPHDEQRSPAAAAAAAADTTTTETVTADGEPAVTPFVGSSVDATMTDAGASAPMLSSDSKDQIIESLKARLREYESQHRHQDQRKCLICMDEFRIPVVSICCWHVHCEECWLRTLGARKLCPQCKMITSPTDLRRIYM